VSDETWVPDPHCGPVDGRAWDADAEARAIGRVEIFNATRPDGLDGWTMSVERYSFLREHILDAIDRGVAKSQRVQLGEVIQAAKDRYSGNQMFRHARVRNLALYVALDLQARCEIEATPNGRSSLLRRSGVASALVDRAVSVSPTETPQLSKITVSPNRR